MTKTQDSKRVPSLAEGYAEEISDEEFADDMEFELDVSLLDN